MRIIFKAAAYQKMRAYVEGIEYEISGFGKVEKTKDALIITDVKIFPQTVTGGNTIMDRTALAQFWDDLMVAGEDIGQWKLWWHSHVYMQAFPSGTDTATIEEFDSELPEENWMLSIVTNKYNKIYSRVDIFEPIRCTITDLDWEIDMSEAFVPVDVSAEIAEKVTIEGQKKTAITWLGPKQVSLLPHKPILSEEERKKLHQLFPSKTSSTTVVEGLIVDNNGKPLASN